MSGNAAQRLQQVLDRPEGEVALDEAALLVAAHLRPDVRVEVELRRLDELAAGVADPTPAGVVAHLAGLGFQGDSSSYYDVQNSLLPAVLDRRRGIPLSLAVIAIEVGRRRSVPLHGIGMPGHFLLGSTVGDDLYDLFAGPASLDAAAARRRFERLHPNQPWDPAHLTPVGAHAIVGRMLTNLASAHRRIGDRHGLVESLRLRLLVPGAGVLDRRSLAAALTADGRYDEAARVIEDCATPTDRHAAASLRARLN